ncbi:MAG: hypothetical protein AAGD25_19795 [Cyanobacteria bacterium P01_F01_bin.150]
MATVVTAPQMSMVLHSVSWQTYEGLVRDLESEPGKRLTYDQGVLEIMVPLPPHERYKSLMGRLVEVTTEETNTEMSAWGQPPGDARNWPKG